MRAQNSSNIFHSLRLVNLFEFDSNVGKLGSNSARQIFNGFELGSSSFKNLMNEPEHSKAQLDSARLQPYLPVTQGVFH